MTAGLFRGTPMRLRRAVGLLVGLLVAGAMLGGGGAVAADESLNRFLPARLFGRVATSQIA